ncbi:hypothetical protein DFH29DRAFT_881289 [Suillus ampliporus]|nr:hypothetical protein DFH29DRAFT_881289 [Suillus ampliporus]
MKKCTVHKRWNKDKSVVEECESQWDDDKYRELSKFLMNNYVQVQHIINEYSDAVANLSSSLGIVEDDFEQWIQEEQQFLMDLKEEPVDRILACSYVQVLIELENANSFFDVLAAKNGNALLMPSGTSLVLMAVNYAKDAHETTCLEAKCRAALDVLMVCIRAVENLEEHLDGFSNVNTEFVTYKKAVRRL